MITKNDTQLVINGTHVTKRRWVNADGSFVRGDLFVGGWRRGTYKTQAGLNRAAAKIQ